MKGGFRARRRARVRGPADTACVDTRARVRYLAAVARPRRRRTHGSTRGAWCKAWNEAFECASSAGKKVVRHHEIMPLSVHTQHRTSTVILVQTEGCMVAQWL